MSRSTTFTGVICIWIVPDTAAPDELTSAPAGNVTFTPSRPVALPPPSMLAMSTAASRGISITSKVSLLRPAGSATSFTCSANPVLATPIACSPLATGSVALPLASVVLVPEGELRSAPATNRPNVSITVTVSEAVACCVRRRYGVAATAAAAARQEQQRQHPDDEAEKGLRAMPDGDAIHVRCDIHVMSPVDARARTSAGEPACSGRENDAGRARSRTRGVRRFAGPGRRSDAGHDRPSHAAGSCAGAVQGKKRSRRNPKRAASMRRQCGSGNAPR